MADNTAAIAALFQSQVAEATTLANLASSEITTAFNALKIPDYVPYNWATPSAPIIGPYPFPTGPNAPVRPQNPKDATVLPFTGTLPNPTFGATPVNTVAVPTLNFPTAPGGEPTDNTGLAPTVGVPNFPTKPGMLTLPSTALPYPFVTIPAAPLFSAPAFDGVKPDDITNITLTDYLQKLSDSYTKYSQLMPSLIQNNAMTWFRAFLNENPNIRLLDGLITTYMTAGGTGVPTTLEEAIITRAVDRVAAENRRANSAVWGEMTRKGLTLPSGALMAGLREARQTAAEATSKVAVDVAIKNLELEHAHMEFMMKLGVELQTLLLNYAGDTGKVVAEINGQAIELTKTVLSGMVEINNAMIRIYLAKWEGYKAAVEVFKAKWMAIEAQIRIFEAQIKAELAKTEVNKATVDILTAMANANRAIAEMYKTQVDAETAKIETDRVRVMAYEATVRGYISKVEAYKARWDGYTAGVGGQMAVAKVYQGQIEAYTANVGGYKAGVDAYVAQVHGYTAGIEATARQNEAELKRFSVQIDGLLKGYAADSEAYGRQWSAIGEQVRGGATVLGIQAEFMSKMYTSQVQIDIERSREHLGQWQSQLTAAVQGAAGLSHTAGVAGDLAGKALAQITGFAGSLSTSIN